MLAILTVRIRDFYPVTGILQLDFPILTILDTPVTRYLRLIPLRIFMKGDHSITSIEIG